MFNAKSEKKNPSNKASTPSKKSYIEKDYDDKKLNELDKQMKQLENQRDVALRNDEFDKVEKLEKQIEKIEQKKKKRSNL